MLVIRPQGLQQIGKVCGPEILIHQGNLLLQIWFVPFAQASRYKHLIDLTRFFLANVLQDGIDTLFLGIVNKATGVDHGNVAFPFMDHIFITGLQLAHQHL